MNAALSGCGYFVHVPMMQTELALYSQGKGRRYTQEGQ